MLRTLSVLLAALLLPTAVAASPEAETAPTGESRPPVLLEGGMLFTPGGTTCTGIAPEVKLRVSLDERGRVAETEVLDVQPSTRLDEVFRRAAIEGVGSWRYSPAIVGGEPTATELRWTVQFAPKSGFVPNPHMRADVGTVYRVEDAAERRVGVSLLPDREKQELLRCYSRVAEEKLVNSRRRRTESRRFVVISDSPQEEAVSIVAGNLEAAWGVLEDLFAPAMELRDGGDEKIVVYLFSSEAAYRSAVDDLGLFVPWQGGAYLPPGFFLFHIERSSSAGLVRTLLHEVFHAFSDRHLVRRGDRLPLWMEEGFAEYLASSRIKNGEILPGKTRKREYFLIPYWGVAQRRTASGWNAKRVRQAIYEDRELSLGELLEAEIPLFYGEDRWLFYPSAWLFVHFLRHDGKDETAVERFASLALYLAEGYPARAAVESVYGDLAELETRFRRYVRRF